MGVLPRVLLIGLAACSCRDENALDPRSTPTFKNPNVSGGDDGVPDEPPTYGRLDR
jgi:hypothetical protein